MEDVRSSSSTTPQVSRQLRNWRRIVWRTHHAERGAKKACEDQNATLITSDWPLKNTWVDTVSVSSLRVQWRAVPDSETRSDLACTQVQMERGISCPEQGRPRHIGCEVRC